MNSNIKEKGKIVLEIAKSCGCSASRVTISESKQSSYSVRDSKLDRLHLANSSSLYIQLFNKGRYGVFSTNRTECEELKQFVEHAAQMTKLLAPDNFRSLPESTLYYKGPNVNLGQYDSSYESIDAARKKQITFDSFYDTIERDKRIVSLNCEFADSLEIAYIIDSQGFEGESKSTSFNLSSECSIKGKGDARPEGWWYESSMFFKDLKITDVGAKSLERALSRLNPIKMKSGRYTMVVENVVSSRLIAPIFSALNGSSIQQNNSFLKDKAGQKVFSEKLYITDTPHKFGAAGSRLFDSEGVATKDLKIIERGVVNTYFINTYNSKKLNLPVTIESPSVPTCMAKGKTESLIGLADILKYSNRGILVTGFNGGNSNSSTGDFSFGVQGLYFEDGVIKHPVKEMNITGNIITLWNNLIATGGDPRESGRWLIPTLAFENVNFNGI